MNVTALANVNRVENGRGISEMVVTLDDGTTVPILIGGSASSPLEVTDPSVSTSFEQPTTRVYWHIDQ